MWWGEALTRYLPFHIFLGSGKPKPVCHYEKLEHAYEETRDWYPESELLCDLKTSHRDPKLAVLLNFYQLDTLESSGKMMLPSPSLLYGQ